MASKWDTRKPARVKEEPKVVDPDSICRVVPARLARIDNIHEWLFQYRAIKSSKHYDDILKRRYLELRTLNDE